MPKLSISLSDYMYWKLTGIGESTSNIIQKALQEYLTEKQDDKLVDTEIKWIRHQEID